MLRESVTGEVVSNVVTKFLMEHHPDAALKSNGRSDYPDLYLATLDYSALPHSERKTVTTEDEYGAAVKRKAARSRSRRPGDQDCRHRIAVDCHHPHAGLHLVLLFSGNGSDVHRRATCASPSYSVGDYRESERNTTATTVKYSFGGDRFVSLLPAG